MFNKNTCALLCSILLLEASVNKLQCASAKEEATHTEIYVISETFKKEIAKLIHEFVTPLDKKALGDLLNLLNIEVEIKSFFLDSMEKSAQASNTAQQAIAEKSKTFYQTIQTYRKSCSPKTITFLETITACISKEVPANIPEELEKAKTVIEKAGKKVSEGKLNAEEKKRCGIARKKFEINYEKFETITGTLRNYVYQTLYTTAENLCKQCLVKKISIDGIINVTKRTEKVIHPDAAEAILGTAGKIFKDIQLKLIDSIIVGFQEE